MRTVQREDLATELVESFVPRPERVDLSGIVETADENAVVRIMRQQAQDDRKWARDNLALAAGLNSKPREIQEKHALKMADFFASYEKAMADETPSYRRAVYLGTFDQRLAGTASTKFEAQKVINGLVLKELLVKNESGPFIVFDERYAVPAKATFKEVAEDIPDLLKDGLIEEHSKGVLIVADTKKGPDQVVRYRTVLPPKKSDEPESKLPESEDGEEPGEEPEKTPLPPEIRENYELARDLEDFLRRFRQADYEIRTKTAERLFAKADLSLDEFLAGNAGTITLGVPPEQVFKDDGVTPETREDDSEVWRAGGTLLVRNDGTGNVWPVSAGGGIQRGVDQAAAMKKVFVPHDRLEQDSFGYLPGLTREEYGKAVLVWHLLRRGIAAAKKEQAIKDQKTKLAAGVDLISMADFLLKGKSGFCLIESERPWEPHVTNGDKPVYISPFYFLAERFVQGEGDDAQSFIRVVRAPQDVEIYLAPCSGDHPDGDKFSNCPQPLRVVLQAIYGQTANNARLAKKYNHTS